MWRSFRESSGNPSTDGVNKACTWFICPVGTRDKLRTAAGQHSDKPIAEFQVMELTLLAPIIIERNLIVSMFGCPNRALPRTQPSKMFIPQVCG
jgi:hypothetical protein